MLPPGLLPDSNEPRRSPFSWMAAAVVLTSLLALIGMLVQVRRLTRERDDERKRLEELVAALKKSVDAPPALPVPEGLPLEKPKPPEAPPALIVPPVAVVPAARRASEVRAAQEAQAERISQGLHEFRSARYGAAELQCFRAVPDSYLYLALSGLARGDWREALGFLSRAMAADPQWLRRANPRDLFGTEAEYRRVLQGVEARVMENPLDTDAKVLLAYLRYHDQGAPYAKALLIEVTNVKPDHEEAKRFLEVLGP